MSELNANLATRTSSHGQVVVDPITGVPKIHISSAPGAGSSTLTAGDQAIIDQLMFEFNAKLATLTSSERQVTSAEDLKPPAVALIPTSESTVPNIPRTFQQTTIHAVITETRAWPG